MPEYVVKYDGKEIMKHNYNNLLEQNLFRQQNHYKDEMK